MTRRDVFLRLLAAVTGYGVMEGLLFHTGLYPTILEPDSAAGALETRLRNELLRPKPDRRQVLGIGHSRMALLPRIANQSPDAGGYTFATVGLGGTSPRCWYYELRYLDPRADRYAAIVVAVDDYNEPDEYDNLDDRLEDLSYVVARLGWRDAVTFPASFETAAARWVALRGIVLKGFVYKRDFLELLQAPMARLERARANRENSAAALYNLQGEVPSLAGIEIDWQRRRIRYPETIAADQRQVIEYVLFRPYPPDVGRRTAYFLRWYGRILDHYRGSSTKVIFYRVPRAPVPPPARASKPSSAVRQMAARPEAIVFDEHLFDSLERPEFFMDPLHLNRDGMEQFSKMLAAELRKVLIAGRP